MLSATRKIGYRNSKMMSWAPGPRTPRAGVVGDEDRHRAPIVGGPRPSSMCRSRQADLAAPPRLAPGPGGTHRAAASPSPQARAVPVAPVPPGRCRRHAAHERFALRVEPLQASETLSPLRDEARSQHQVLRGSTCRLSSMRRWTWRKQVKIVVSSVVSRRRLDGRGTPEAADSATEPGSGGWAARDTRWHGRVALERRTLESSGLRRQICTTVPCSWRG